MIRIIYNASFALLAVLSFTLLLIAILAYERSKEKKFLFLITAFFLFLVKALWLTQALFRVPIGDWHPFLILVAVIDSIILILIYLSILKG